MRRACPRGSTGTSHARRSAAREGAAQRARVPPNGLRGQALPKANYDNRAPFFVRQGIQFRVSWDNPTGPFRGVPFRRTSRVPFR